MADLSLDVAPPNELSRWQRAPAFIHLMVSLLVGLVLGSVVGVSWSWAGGALVGWVSAATGLMAFLVAFSARDPTPRQRACRDTRTVGHAREFVRRPSATPSADAVQPTG